MPNRSMHRLQANAEAAQFELIKMYSVTKENKTLLLSLFTVINNDGIELYGSTDIPFNSQMKPFNNTTCGSIYLEITRALQESSD